MRNFTVMLSLFVLFAASMFSVSTADRIHQVGYGDTLWDLSIRYYDTPFHWEDILEANESLEGVEYLQPGTELIIPDMFASTVSSVAYDESFNRIYTTSISSSRPLLSRLLLETTGMVTDNPPDPVCYILETNVEDEEKFAVDDAYPGDIVVIDIGQDQGVVPGRVYKILKIGEEVKHPRTGEAIGWVYRVAGICSVTGTTPSTSVAVIEHAYLPVSRGDYLIPYTSSAPVAVSHTDVIEGIDAYVIAFQDNDAIQAYAFDIIYLDRGFEDGLCPGDVFSMFKYGHMAESVSGSIVMTPDIPVSQLIILDTTRSTSAAMIFSSSSFDLIEIGDRIELVGKQL